MRRVIAGCSAVLALLVFPVGAGADVGALSPLGASSATGLIGAWDVAISPDSKSVYVVGNGSDTIVTFSRDPATGALAPQGCIADVGDAAGCGETQQGLDGAIGVAVTPDGKSVYVASEKDHAVARFNRAPDGKLTPAGCIADAGDPSATGCGATQEGLLQANDIAANNKSVYVVSRGDHALVHFDRPTVEPVTGEIAGQGCIEDIGSPAACSGETEGLLDAQAVTISADGKSVYVVSREEDAIVRFARNEEGSLVAQGCISDVGGADCGLGNTRQGLGGARDVAVSGDGKSVYVASQGDSAVVGFTRDVNGGLSGQGCVEDVGGATGCGVTQEGLSGAYGVAVSPDGLSAYVVGSSDHAIARFDRGADGALTPRGSTTAPGLGFPLRVAVSPDNTSVYVPGNGSNNVFGFFRATTADSVPPTVTPLVVPTAPPQRVSPNNVFEIESVFAPKRNGTVTFDVNLPGGGTILVHATGEVTGPPRRDPQARGSAKANVKTITIARKQVTAKRAGRLRIKLAPRRKAKLYLERDGRLKAKVKLTFTPTGGTPRSVTRQVTFRLERRPGN